MEAIAQWSEATDNSRRRPGRPTLSNEQLLDKALELFLENGFERTGIDAIAAAAGMAKRTVYARYADKTVLFKAALKRAIEEWIVPVERLQAAECPDLEETLLKIAQLLLANLLSAEGLRLLRLSNAVSVSMPEIAAYNTRMGTEPTLEYLADLFRRRLLPADAPGAEAEEAALAFLHMAVGGPASTAAWGVQFSDDAVERHSRYCVRLFLHGSLPAQGSAVIERENRRLKSLVRDAARQLVRASEILEMAGISQEPGQS